MLGATNTDLYIFILGCFVFSQSRYTLIKITLKDTDHVSIKVTLRRVGATTVAEE